MRIRRKSCVNSICTCGCVAMLVFFAPLKSLAENWPQWRGPRGDGISLEKNLPTTWTQTKNVLWKTPIPGEGHSSPMVWENNLFITSALKSSGRRTLLRLNTETGQIVWQKTVVTTELESMHRQNSPASSSPVTDGKYVFTSFQVGNRVDVQCFDYDGNRIWSIQPLRLRVLHGYSYTPLIYKDLVIFDFAQNDEAAVLAIDKDTGKIRWRYRRKSRDISHVTPLLVKSAGINQLITCGSEEIRSFDPDTGKSIWWCDGPSEVSVAALVFGNDTVFATAGYPRKTRIAVRTTGRRNVTRSNIVWKSTREVSYVPSPIYHEGYVYIVLDNGMIHCHDAQTGESVWSHRLKGSFRTSLLLANEHLYTTNDEGLTTIFEASPDGFQLVAENPLNEFSYASPAASNGRLYIRTGKHVYCIGK